MTTLSCATDAAARCAIQAALLAAGGNTSAAAVALGFDGGYRSLLRAIRRLDESRVAEDPELGKLMRKRGWDKKKEEDHAIVLSVEVKKESIYVVKALPYGRAALLVRASGRELAAGTIDAVTLAANMLIGTHGWSRE